MVILKESVLALQDGSDLETEVKSSRSSIPVEDDGWEERIATCSVPLGKDEPGRVEGGQVGLQAVGSPWARPQPGLRMPAPSCCRGPICHI